MVRISGIAYNSDFTICSNSVITFALAGGGRDSNVQGNTDGEGHFSVELGAGTWQSDKVIVSGTIIEED